MPVNILAVFLEGFGSIGVSLHSEGLPGFSCVHGFNSSAISSLVPFLVLLHILTNVSYCLPVTDELFPLIHQS